MDLQSIFNTIVGARKTVTLTVADRKEYDSLRVSLLRKYAGYAKLCADAGIDRYDSLYLKARWHKETSEATFSLIEKAEAARLRKDYVVKLI